MSQKTFKYGHLYSTSASTAPANGSMIPGELALGLKSGEEKLWAFDGTNIIDLGSALGGILADELTVHKKLIPAGQPNAGQKVLSTLVYLKDVTATEANLPANVKKRYRLVDANGDNIVTESGDTSDFIDVYKDSSIVEIYIGTNYDSVNATTGAIDKKQIGDVVDGHTIDAKDFQYLNEVYFAGGYSGSTISGDGEYHMVKIDLTQFLIQPEFESGVTVNANGVVTGVVDANTDILVTEWTDGDASAAGVSATTQSGLTVGADGFKMQYVQDAINAKHANTIKMNGYTSGVTEDLFGIVSGDTVMQAVKKIEDKLCSNGTGVAAGGGVEVNNTGLVFIENDQNIVLLGAGTY